jgi:hypothetical protein
MKKPSKRERAADAPSKDDRRESGEPGGGAGRRDEVGPTGVYPMSGGLPEGKHPELRNPASWGQGERGAEGYEDSGGSELYMHDGQLLGGLTAGPGGEPTIDIHGGDRTGVDESTVNAEQAKRARDKRAHGERTRAKDDEHK